MNDNDLARHRLRCLAALGYPASWVSQQTGYDATRWIRDPLLELTPDEAAAVTIVYRKVGERTATVENTGSTRVLLASTRRRAAQRGWLPPMAYDEDERGVPILTDTAAAAVRPARGSVPEPRDQQSYSALRLLALALMRNGSTCIDISHEIGLGDDLTRILAPVRITDLRSSLAWSWREWYRPAMSTAVLHLWSGVEIGMYDAIEAWALVVRMYQAPEAAVARWWATSPAFTRVELAA